MAVTRYAVDIIGQQLPADPRQRKLATIFSSTPGEKVLPAPYWYHNVMPTARGMKSLSFSPLENLPPLDSAITQRVEPHYAVLPSIGLITIPIYVVNNFLYTYSINTSEWRQDFDLKSSPIQPSYGYTSGETYLFHPEFGLQKQSTATMWEPVTLSWGEGVEPPDLGNFLGIAVVNGYLVLYDRDRVYWSSPTDPEEFGITKGGVSTGAGSANVQAVLGSMVRLVPISGGVIIYTTRNMVSMRYTNNAKNPWVFNQIVGSSGVTDSKHIATTDSASTHYVWSSAGLTAVNLSQARNILPEWTQRISSRNFHYVEDGTLKELNGTVNVKLAMAGEGILIMSVGEEENPYNGAWLYDLTLNRWGRIDVDHWDVKQFRTLVGTNIETYQSLITKGITFADLLGQTIRSLGGQNRTAAPVTQAITLMGADNRRYRCDLAAPSENADSFILIGDVRLSRNRACTVQEVRAQATDGDVSNMGLSIYTHNQDWQDFIYNTYEPETFVGMASGNWHTVKVQGDFTISAIELTLQQAGAVV